MYQNFNFFSQYLYSKGYIPVVGSKERRKRKNKIEIHGIYKGVPFSWGKNLGVFVVFDENGHPWVTNEKNIFDRKYISDLCERGAYVPHCWKKSNFFKTFSEIQKKRKTELSNLFIMNGFSCIIACDVWLLNTEELFLFNDEVLRFGYFKEDNDKINFLKKYPDKLKLAKPCSYQFFSFEKFFIVTDENGLPWVSPFLNSFQEFLELTKKIYNSSLEMKSNVILEFDSKKIIKNFLGIAFNVMKEKFYPALDLHPKQKKEIFLNLFDKRVTGG